MTYIHKLAALILLAPLTAAAWFSIHLAAADAQFQRRAPESVARAIAIEPRNTDYLALRALQLDYDGVDSTPLLERAAQLSPLSSSPRIRLGLLAEIRGDFESAEKWLLDAARVDRQFEARWTLANFYFRRASAAASGNEISSPFWDQSAGRFWNVMREALAVSYGDRRPAFDLCWRMADASSMDQTTILDRAIPERREVLAAYLQYTLDSHPDAAGPIALKLARFGDPSDRLPLLAACDRLIASRHNTANDEENGTAHDAALALRLWSAIGYAAPAGIFNGSFTTPPVNHGFDWRLIESPGVVHTALDQPRPARRIALDGRQPESCALLTQIVNLEPHARYTLRWGARTSGFSAPAGIEWRIGDVRAAILPSDTPAFGSAAFMATSEIETLTLFYQRPAGQARAEGLVELSRVSIEKSSEKDALK
jgi:tetratricopeptide (TPR) repeat protein